MEDYSCPAILMIKLICIFIVLLQSDGCIGYGVIENYPHAFLKREGDICYQLRPSFCLSAHPLNRWMKSYQIGRATAFLFLTRPLGPWGGVNRSNINKFQLQGQFDFFLYQT